MVTTSSVTARRRERRRMAERLRQLSAFSLGDVVNQQTHFTCNEDPTRAALVISTKI